MSVLYKIQKQKDPAKKRAMIVDYLVRYKMYGFNRMLFEIDHNGVVLVNKKVHGEVVYDTYSKGCEIKLKCGTIFWETSRALLVAQLNEAFKSWITK